jgi:hypothetical protein
LRQCGELCEEAFNHDVILQWVADHETKLATFGLLSIVQFVGRLDHLQLAESIWVAAVVIRTHTCSNVQPFFFTKL